MAPQDPVALLGELALTSAWLVSAVDRVLEDAAGLTYTAVAILQAAADQPGIAMGELNAVVTLSGSGLTRAVDRLLATGLVEREADPSDRRVVRINLTHEGRRRLTKANRAQSAVLTELLSPLTATETRQMRLLMAKLHPLHTGGSQ